MHAYTTDLDIDVERYEKITAGFGPEPLEGQIVHLCIRKPDGGLRYIDVWESPEAAATAFAERIHPAVDAAFDGDRPPEPQIEVIDVVDVRFGPQRRRVGY